MLWSLSEFLCFSRWVSFCWAGGDTIKDPIGSVWIREEAILELFNANLHVVTKFPEWSRLFQWGSGLTTSVLNILRNICKLCKHLPDCRNWYRDRIYQHLFFFPLETLLILVHIFQIYNFESLEHCSLILKQLSFVYHAFKLPKRKRFCLILGNVLQTH